VTDDLDIAIQPEQTRADEDYSEDNESQTTGRSTWISLFVLTRRH